MSRESTYHPALSRLAAIAAVLTLSGCALLTSYPGAGLQTSPSVGPSYELRVRPGSFGKSAQRVRVFDASGDVWEAREATRAEMEMDRGMDSNDDADADLVLFDDENHVLVRWHGATCERETRISIDESGNTIVIRTAPHDGCDAAGVTYGVVLNYDTNRDADHLRVEYR